MRFFNLISHAFFHPEGAVHLHLSQEWQGTIVL